MIQLLWLILAIPVVLLAAVGLRYLVRGTPISRVRPPRYGYDSSEEAEDLFAQSLELHTQSNLVTGHEVELFTCGDELYPRLWDDLRSAERSITLQLYYCQPGRMANELLEILSERARAGVRVLFLQDAFGSGPLPDSYNEALREAGVTVAVFRPVRWYDLEKAYNRSHIRVVTVDAKVGYTGGFGLDDKWWGDGISDGEWRDSSVRMTGAAVAQFQAVFAAGWAEATGNLITGSTFFAGPDAVPNDGGVCAGIVHAAPTIGSTIGERFLALIIAGARKRLWITNAYFVPPTEFVELLTSASRRGVDVRILTAGDQSDVKSTAWAGRASYEELVASGVRVFEYLPTTHHAKTLVSDTTFSSVGTMNFDNRSLAFNDETMLLVRDEGFARRMEEAFLADQGRSMEMTLESLSARPWHRKLLERGAALMTRIL